MDSFKKLEKMVGSWFKMVPSLPAAGQKWLAENVWWIALIGLVLSVIGIFVTIFAVIAIASWTSGLDYYGYATVDPYSATALAGSVVSLIFSIVIVGLTAVAISPLKAQRFRGWALLFTIYVVSAVEIVLNSILSFNPIGFIFGIIGGAIGLAIGGYFLFQIRAHFGAGVKTAHVVTPKK
jgi:hypothetical protein